MRSGRGIQLGVGAGVVVIAFFIALITSGATVSAGNVGVLTTFGQPTNQPLDPGFHLILPVAQRITPVSIQVQNHTFREVDASSKELQSVKLDGGVNYHVDRSKAVTLYTTVGLDFATKVFDPAFQDYIKEVVPQYNATDILSHRDEIRTKAKEKLAATAGQYGIDVIDVFLTNISFSPEYTKAIEAKQIAAQQLEQAKVSAQTAVTQAQGQANAQIEQAKGDAEANRLRSQNLTPELINYLMIQKWDGHLPQVTGGASPFVSLTAAKSS